MHRFNCLDWQDRRRNDAATRDSLQPGAMRTISSAEDCLLKSIDWSRRQGALSWELRATTSLARLLHRQNRTAEARKCLLPVYSRFTEGFETTDLQCARRLLEEHLT